MPSLGTVSQIVERLGKSAAYDFGRAVAEQPGLFSKLEEVAKGFNFGKMDAEQLKKTLVNKQVSPSEVQQTLGELSGTVTKPQLLDEISSKGIVTKDVILGEPPKAGGLSEDDLGNILRGNYDGVDTYKDTKYSQYVEPGAEPGSYREMFVTAPKETTEKFNIKKTDKGDYAILDDGGNFVDRTSDLIIANRLIKDRFGRVWSDGHSLYSDIQNPIVRIRYNDRNADGKKILFVEEIQGPSVAEQEKMPEDLRKRIYDIGVKRVLAKAKEEGYDGVAWTTGKMQADRYDLSEYIDNVKWYKFLDNKNVYIDVISKEGKQLNLGEVQQDKLANAIGKDAAYKIISSDSLKGELKDLNLQVGGEGLKSVYDKTLPEKFKKYGKGNIQTLNIDSGTVHYMPLTEKTPSRYPIYSILPATMAAGEFGSKYFNKNDVAQPRMY